MGKIHPVPTCREDMLPQAYSEKLDFLMGRETGQMSIDLREEHRGINL